MTNAAPARPERSAKTRPAVTVALPAFNAASTIDYAVRSVLAQTFADFELLVLDDGSRDDTASRVARFRDPRILLVTGDRNEGLSARLNQAIDMAGLQKKPSSKPRRVLKSL